MAKETDKKPEDAKKNDAPGTDVALKQSSGTALEKVDFGDDAGKGMENMTRDEYIIPFLRILQKGSPQVYDEDAKTGIPGVKAGMLFNTATNETYKATAGSDPGVLFVPVARDHNFVEYIPQHLGKGFVGIRPVNDPVVLKLREEQGQFGKLAKDVTARDAQGLQKDGTEISETYYLYGLLLEERFELAEGELFAYYGVSARVMVAFSSTQIKKYKGMINRLDNFKYLNNAEPPVPVTPPIWAHVWRLLTQQEENKKGKFKGWVISLAGKNADGTEARPVKSLTADPVYTQAKEFATLISKGKAKVDYSKAAPDAPEEDEIPM